LIVTDYLFARFGTIRTRSNSLLRSTMSGLIINQSQTDSNSYHGKVVKGLIESAQRYLCFSVPFISDSGIRSLAPV
jgi:hypothetical protein